MKTKKLGEIKIHDILIQDLTKEKIRELFIGRFEDCSLCQENILDSSFLNKTCDVNVDYSNDKLKVITFIFKDMFIRGFERAIYAKYKDMFIHERNYDRLQIEVPDLYIFDNGYIAVTISKNGGFYVKYVVMPYEETKQMLIDADNCTLENFIGI